MAVSNPILPGPPQPLGMPNNLAVAVAELDARIFNIIMDYSLNKFDDSSSRIAEGIPNFLATINEFVAAGDPIRMCLPAFPFKSVNKVEKAFGILPDKAEEIALGRLNTMCSRIEEIYEPGAQLTIISDGLVYNDLLCIPDKDVWAYGQAIRAMVLNCGFTHIDFSNLRDLVSFPLPAKLEEITYVANATNFRRYLLNKYGKEDLNINHEIATKTDTLLTYRGYCRFLESDLQHVFPAGNGLTNNGYKRNVKFLAKEMLVRGYAFAGAVKNGFPHHLRLSIHHATGEHKVPISLLDTETGYTTPWHCSVAQMADGRWLSGTKTYFESNPSLEVAYEDGRPSYYRAKVLKENGTNGVNVVATEGTTGVNGANGVQVTNGINGANDVNGTNGINGTTNGINGTTDVINGIKGVNSTVDIVGLPGQ